MANNRKTSKGKRTGVIIVVVILTLAVFIAVARPKRSSYTEVTSTTGDITTYFSFPGTIAANNSQIVYADSALQVMEVQIGRASWRGRVLI